MQDLEREVHRKEYPVCLPSYTSGIQEMDPPASSRPRKISNFRNFIILAASSHYYGIIQLQVLHGIYPTTRSYQTTTPATSSDLRSRTHVKFPDPLFNHHDSVYGLGVKIDRQTNSVSNATIQPTKSKLDLRAAKGSIKRPQRSGASQDLVWAANSTPS
jgi:hypothetical protein